MAEAGLEMLIVVLNRLECLPNTTAISRGNERKLIIVIENMGKNFFFFFLQQKQPVDAFKHDSSQTDVLGISKHINITYL